MLINEKMVRGRRAKNFVATIRSDNSPDPKRKVQKLGAHTIREFFQAVAVDDPKIGLEEHIKNITPIKTRNRVLYSNKATCKQNGFADFDFKEAAVNKKTDKVILSDVASPPTPHRIELCSDTSEDGPKEVATAKALDGTPKARRKLINHLENQQNAKNRQPPVEPHKLTDFFQVRRSVRKTKSTVLEEKQRTLEQILRKDIEEGLEVRLFEGKGRGVVAAKPFAKGDFVVEYSGDLIDIGEAKKREETYSQNENTGCYMYYFKHNGQQYCIDATPESGRLGRLVNHSRNGNLVTRTVPVDGKPRLVLIAKDDIQIGDEVCYDYGDRSKESLKHYPWLAY